MATYSVLPRDDGHDFQGSWMIHVNGQMKSKHTTKAAAKNQARGYASDGDTLVIHRTDGTIQKRVTVQDATAYDSENEERSQPGMYGMGTMKDAFGKR